MNAPSNLICTVGTSLLFPHPRIVIVTEAQTPGQIEACIADLNARLEE